MYFLEKVFLLITVITAHVLLLLLNLVLAVINYKSVSINCLVYVKQITLSKNVESCYTFLINFKKSFRYQ